MTPTLAQPGERHRAAFAAMHADASVMADLGRTWGGPIDRAASDAKFDRYVAGWADHGIGRWMIEDILEGAFLGYTSVVVRDDAAHPLGRHREIGWRLRREAWGRGYATAHSRAAQLRRRRAALVGGTVSA